VPSGYDQPSRKVVQNVTMLIPFVSSIHTILGVFQDICKTNYGLPVVKCSTFSATMSNMQGSIIMTNKGF
jgi:hypothetical protein